MGTREKITPSQKKKLGLFNTHPNQRENLSSVGTILRGVGGGACILVPGTCHKVLAVWLVWFPAKHTMRKCV